MVSSDCEAPGRKLTAAAVLLQEGRSVPVFADSDWRAAEELALLEAVELYGFGNWEDTAALVGRRSADEVRRHFIAYYVRGSVGRGTWSHASPETYQALDHTCSRDGHLSPSLTTPLPAIPDLSLPEQQHLGYMPKRDDFEREFDNEVEMLISTLRINPNDEDDLDVDLKVAHIDMYNRRLRQRFRKKAVVRDYGLVSQFYKSLTGDPEIMLLIHPQSSPSAATSLVSEKAAAAVPVSSSAGVTGDSVSSPASHSGRLQSVSPSSPANGKSHASSPLIPSSPCLTPNRINSNGLTSPAKKRSLSPGKSATPDCLTADRFHDQLRDKFKVFSQFQSALDQKQLLDNVRRERELKSRIKELVRYRKSGIRKLSEVAGLETARSDRDKRKENKKKVRFQPFLSLFSSCWPSLRNSASADCNERVRNQVIEYVSVFRAEVQSAIASHLRETQRPEEKDAIRWRPAALAPAQWTRQSRAVRFWFQRMPHAGPQVPQKPHPANRTRVWTSAEEAADETSHQPLTSRCRPPIRVKD